MFSNSIDSKANKIKLNVDNYLNEKKKETNSQQPIPSVRRPEQQQPPQPLPQSTAPQPVLAPVAPNPAPNQLKPVEVEIKQLVLQGKTFDKQPLILKSIQKERSITIFYS
jgi:hypothetical protein